MVDVKINRSDLFDQLSFSLSSLVGGLVRIHSRTEYKELSGGSVNDATGHGIEYDDNLRPVSGTFTGVTTKYEHQMVEIKGLNLSVESVISAAKSYRTTDDLHLMVHALSGDDSIIGAAFYETLYGFGGDDVITSSRGYATLYGGTGDDVLSAEGGELWGQSGSDTFVLDRSVQSAVFVEDFKASGHNHDLIAVSGFKDIHTFKELQPFLRDFGRNSEVDTDFGTIYIEHVKVKDLHEHDFIFT